jgi:phosphomannomutase
MEPMRARKALRISAVGLRGVVGAGLTASHVIDFASAFGTFLEPGRPVLLGRDPRASGCMMREGVVSGLLACGHEVVDLGVVSSPVIQHAIRRYDAAGGISISASHNTAEWNALRFFGRKGTYLSTAESNELLDIYHLRKFRFPDWRGVGRLRFDSNAIDPYLDELAAVFDLERLKSLKVVVDCCNGTSSLILKRMNERFGLCFILINERLDGKHFAHSPVISADTIALQLAPLMKPLEADAGFQFDVDSDRVGVATREGVAVSEEIILPLIADYLLPRSSGKLVITNLSSSALLEHVVAPHGGKVLRVPVGRQATIDALAGYRSDQIAIAGEGTGAVMMPQFEFIYDGIASMLAVLSLIVERGQGLGGIIAQYPRYNMKKAEAPLTSPRVPELLTRLQKQYADGRINVQDGLRVDWPDRWFHVRVSQTEPILRVICEQKGEPPVRLFENVMEQVRELA